MLVYNQIRTGEELLSTYILEKIFVNKKQNGEIKIIEPLKMDLLI